MPCMERMHKMCRFLEDTVAEHKTDEEKTEKETRTNITYVRET